jgi:hypothetical protein
VSKQRIKARKSEYACPYDGLQGVSDCKRRGSNKVLIMPQQIYKYCEKYGWPVSVPEEYESPERDAARKRYHSRRRK